MGPTEACVVCFHWIDELLEWERWLNYFRFIQSRNNPLRQQPNPLPILMRALNGLWLRLRCIRQPCWKRGRWKSLT